MGDKLDTGVGNGQVADVWLSLKVSLETFGQVLNFFVFSPFFGWMCAV